jgi:hypothetical protein
MRALKRLLFGTTALTPAVLSGEKLSGKRGAMPPAEAAAGTVAGLAACSRYLTLGGTALLVLGGLTWYLSDDRTPSSQQTASTQIVPAQEIPIRERAVPARRVHAVTDQGRSVNVYWVADANSYLEPVLRRENEVAHVRLLRLLRTAPADERYNCYGWLFTDGAYWLFESDISPILLDNGYREVPVPQAGDLVVYRDDDGRIVHCGLVRAAGADGLILVESKWGEGGGTYTRPRTVGMGAA